jgi:hypothetical protein
MRVTIFTAMLVLVIDLHAAGDQQQTTSQGDCELAVRQAEDFERRAVAERAAMPSALGDPTAPGAIARVPSNAGRWRSEAKRLRRWVDANCQ